MKPAKASDPIGKNTSRELAADILHKVETRKAYADLLLDRALKQSSLSPRDGALLTELVYGTLRWRSRLDWHLARYLRRSLSTTDPHLRSVLRLALFQILFLDKVPDYAAVNEAVEHAKRYGGKRGAAFVNGVLRKFLSEKGRVSYPNPDDDLVGYLAVIGSHPQWLVKRWLGQFGRAETEALLQANNEQAPLTLRANLLKGTRDALLGRLVESGLEATPTRWSPQGVRVESCFGVQRLPGFDEGLFYVQGEASQLVGYLLDPKPGGTLVYATCTLTREENEETVENFLCPHPAFVLEDAADHLPGDARQLVSGRYFMALPHRHDTEGFFAARMRKSG
ncbi:MAG: hypothetical protein HYV04_21545 [Deltaproteobacteria bacterium]|nr:hypothetical protein [Deltaproteobacteria bacterium]